MKRIIAILLFLATPGYVFAGSCSANAGTCGSPAAWDTGATWGAGCTGAGGIPAVIDTVTIGGTFGVHAAGTDVASTVTQSASANCLTIDNGATLSLIATAGQVHTVNAGATLTIAAGGTENVGSSPATEVNAFTVTGSGATVNVNGTLNFYDGITCTTNAAFNLNAGGVMQSGGAGSTFNVFTKSSGCTFTMAGTNSDTGSNPGWFTATPATIQWNAVNGNKWYFSDSASANTDNFTWALISRCGQTLQSCNLNVTQGHNGNSTFSHALYLGDGVASGFGVGPVWGGGSGVTAANALIADYLDVRNSADNGHANSLAFGTPSGIGPTATITHMSVYTGFTTAGDASVLPGIAATANGPATTIDGSVFITSFNIAGGNTYPISNTMIGSVIITSGNANNSTDQTNGGQVYTNVGLVPFCKGTPAQTYSSNNNNSVGSFGANIWRYVVVSGIPTSGCNTNKGNNLDSVFLAGGANGSSDHYLVDHMLVVGTVGSVYNYLAAGGQPYAANALLNNLTVYNNQTISFQYGNVITGTNINDLVGLQDSVFDHSPPGITFGGGSAVPLPTFYYDYNNFTNQNTSTPSQLMAPWNNKTNHLGSVCFSNHGQNAFCGIDVMTAANPTVVDSTGLPGSGCKVTLGGTTTNVAVGQFASRTGTDGAIITSWSGGVATLGRPVAGGNYTCLGITTSTPVSISQNYWTVANGRWYGDNAGEGAGNFETYNNPQFANNAATLEAWDTYRGGTGTRLGAIDRWFCALDGVDHAGLYGPGSACASTGNPNGHPDSADSHLAYMSWIRQNFKPHNPALIHAGRPSTGQQSLGAVEPFNPTVMTQ